jgi:hypothetical protein
MQEYQGQKKPAQKKNDIGQPRPAWCVFHHILQFVEGRRFCRLPMRACPRQLRRDGLLQLPEFLADAWAKLLSDDTCSSALAISPASAQSSPRYSRAGSAYSRQIIDIRLLIVPGNASKLRQGRQHKRLRL